MNFKRLLVIAIVAALGALALRSFVFGLYVVPSSSMVPTLLQGDYIFAVNYNHGLAGLGPIGHSFHAKDRIGETPLPRGTIVVFKSPARRGLILVKRLIGLPGDRIKMSRSQLYINGKEVRREPSPASYAFPGDDETTDDYMDYIEYLPDAPAHPLRLLRGMEDEETINNTPEFTIPPRSYFFMGDYRDKSDDSRVSDVGFVPEENLIGQATTIFFSMSPRAHLWEIPKWSWAFRKHRFFMTIR